MSRLAVRRVGERFDWPLFLAVMAIALLGVLNLYSASSAYVGAETRSGLADIYVSQVYWLMLGLLVAVGATTIDYRNLQGIAYVLYWLGAACMPLVFAFASDIRGSKRWIQLGGFTFQPSELMKVVLVIALARYLQGDAPGEPRTVRGLWWPALLTAIPVALVMAQPDLGTSLVLALTAATMLFMQRIRTRTLLGVGASALVALPLLWFFGMHDYQRARVTSFLDPEADKTGTGWHALQAQTAIGNGGWFGEGYLQGIQNQFGFLPDQYSDFPFAVFAEDWGFAGVTVLISLYGFVCVWALHIASRARDRFGAALAIGVGALFFWQALFNVGMCLGVFPVVGITLPLFSYGGSSIITTLVALGLLMNVSMRR